MDQFAAYTIKCYRSIHGDSVAKDAVHPGASLEEVKMVTRDRLLSFFESDRYHGREKPLAADIIDASNKIIATFHVRPTASGSHEVVEAPKSRRT